MKPDGLGDFILSVHALKYLRDSRPEAHITLFVAPRVFELARSIPYVDLVLPIYLFNYKGDDLVSNLFKIKSSLENLNIDRFDLAIILRYDFDYYNACLLSFALEIPIRIGYSVKSLKFQNFQNEIYDQFLTHKLEDQAVESEVIKNLKLVGCNEWPMDYSNINLGFKSSARVLMDRLSELTKFNACKGFVAIGISSLLEIKKINSERWVEYIKVIKEVTQNEVLIFGGQDDIEIGNYLEEKTNSISLCGKLNLLDTIDILSFANFFIGVDSFLKHAASLSGKCVIEFSCQSKIGNPEMEYGGIRFSAYGVKSIVLKPDAPLEQCSIHRCQATNSHCINQISTDELVNAVRSIQNL